MKVKGAFYSNWRWWVCLPYLMLLLPLLSVFYVSSGILWVIKELSSLLYNWLWGKVNYSLGSLVGLAKVRDWVWGEDE